MVTWFASTYLMVPRKARPRSHIRTDSCDPNEQALAARIPGVRGIYAGRLRNCGQIEALTANLVSINRRYKAHAGLRFTDI